MRWLFVVWLLVACRRDDDREARSLASLDPIEASKLVDRWVDSCKGYRRALERLNASGVSERDLIGFVTDANRAADGRCSTDRSVLVREARGDGIAHRLARAYLWQNDPEAAIAELRGGTDTFAILVTRAMWLDRLGRVKEALAELELAHALGTDGISRQHHRLLAVSVAARGGRYDEVARAIAEAPLNERPTFAYRAVEGVAPANLDALLAAAVEPELAIAIGDRLEQRYSENPTPRAALAARARAAVLAPDRAEHHDDHARALADAGQVEAAVAAWDRAAEIAPAQPSYRLAPIRALVAAERQAEARARAQAVAEKARKRLDVDALLVASNAAAIAGDHVAAMTLVEEARSLRPGDGRIAFAMAGRLADTGDRAAAIEAYAELLVCGAHGRSWHRHEVAGKLVALAIDAASAKRVAAALDARRSCATVAAQELGHYVDGARKKLATVAP